MEILVIIVSAGMPILVVIAFIWLAAGIYLAPGGSKCLDYCWDVVRHPPALVKGVALGVARALCDAWRHRKNKP